MKTRTLYSTALTAAFGAAIFACSGNSGSVAPEGSSSSSEDLIGICGPADCGPALGLAALKCPDGSVGGNTGRCIKTTKDPACHWEIRVCPPPPPDCDCGPEPASAIKCWDGSASAIVCEPEPYASSGGGVSSGGSAG